jgi:hypothetical protein
MIGDGWFFLNKVYLLHIIIIIIIIVIIINK